MKYQSDWSVSVNQPEVGSTADLPTSKLLQLEARSSGNVFLRIIGLCQFTLVSSGKSAIPNPETTSSSDPGGTIMEAPTMVPGTSV